MEREAFEKELEDLGLVDHHVRRELRSFEVQMPVQYRSFEVPISTTTDPCFIPDNEKPKEPVMGVLQAPPFSKDAYWPLVSSKPPLVAYRKRGGGSTPYVGDYGAQFDALRPVRAPTKYHAAIDLLANDNDRVIAIEDGGITRFADFYSGTWEIRVKHSRVTVIYGEVSKDSLVYAGLAKKIGPFIASSSQPPIPVKAGQTIGRVGKNDYNTTMLHTEIFDNNYKRNAPWLIGNKNRHIGLYDPSLALLMLAKCGKRAAGSQRAKYFNRSALIGREYRFGACSSP